ncbi:isochorismate synthase [Amycolatopsis sp. H20-H5]|uniref:isochorismate synthase n=1 Tax=Amycolatopsis sp. H20-H5 TaxID=3046309 RepID=UPI002DB777AB|nr:isochorismate synthase [Amycolatopsis sp. H20-H5]MEC3975295.1 isochorismate synthase [Amycolatopsis sp. H20-H5]
MTQSAARTASVKTDDLLRSYARGDFLFASPQRTVLGRGAETVLTDMDPVRLAEAVSTRLATAAVPMAVGILPFDTRPEAATPGRMVIPRELRVGGPAHPEAALLPRESLPRPLATKQVPLPELHLEAVARAVQALKDRDLRKVVLARALDLEFADPIRVETILRNLVQDNPRGYGYAAELPLGRTMVGATPELLLAREGRHVRSHPHAGSMPRSADPAVDRANADALMASKKDHVEHAVLTEAVVEILRPFCRRLDVPAEPVLVGNPAVWHLGTTITGELDDPGVTALHLAAALHPTPAICGTPTADARSLVCELEPFDRAYYAGAVGWVDAQGDGEWAVAIRCAEIAATSMRLYAGGGIVPASDPHAELEETSAKFWILLQAMGLEPLVTGQSG